MNAKEIVLRVHYAIENWQFYSRNFSSTQMS